MLGVFVAGEMWSKERENYLGCLGKWSGNLSAWGEVGLRSMPGRLGTQSNT